MELRSVKEASVTGKRVILRAGLNVPVSDGRIVDDFRLSRAAQTIGYLAGQGARVIVLAHIGRSGESLRPVMEALGAHLPGVPLLFGGDDLAEDQHAADSLKDGEVLVLENMRRFSGEEENDTSLSQALAALGDIFVNDAFADSHRAHASIVGVAKLLPSYAGLLMFDEVEHLSPALSPEHPSLAIIGGAKFETKEPLMERLVEHYDRVCVGGAIVNDFLKAKGYEVGVSLVSEKGPSAALLAHPRIELPSDIVVAGEGPARTTTLDGARAHDRIVDAGHETGERWTSYIHEAKFVLMNGPLGIYERGFNAETEVLAHAIAKSGAHAVVGGGDTIAAIQKTNFDPARVFLSTGGGAMLQFLTDGTLPGLEALTK
jgi:phosphoglycerate kinase